KRPPMGDGVALPSSYPEDSPGPLWTQVDRGLIGFVGSIINTGLFYRDILQSRLPSYYDRTISVLLTDSEGGMNLEMPRDVIQSAALKGYQAGEALQDGHGFNFDHHRWVRLRLMLRQLEQQMIDLRRTIRDNPGPADIDRLSPYLASMHEFLE